MMENCRLMLRLRAESRRKFAHRMQHLSLLVSLTILAGACTGPSSTEPDGKQETDSRSPSDEFESDLERLCDDLHAKSDELNAGTEEEFNRLSQEFIEAQETFVARAGELSPPSGIESEFERYLFSTKEFIELNEQSVRGNQSRHDSLELSLDAAEKGAELFARAQTANLPESCPPSPGGDVYGFLFQARANVACFDLGTELAQLGALQAETKTRKESARLLKFIQALATELAVGIKAAVPPEVGDAEVDRMVELYERSAELLGDVRRAFVEEDGQLYEATLRQQQKATLSADRMAHSMGLVECVNFIGAG